MLYDTDADDLIRFARRRASLGDAVAGQVERVLDCPRVAAGLIESQADQPRPEVGAAVADAVSRVKAAARACR